MQPIAIVSRVLPSAMYAGTANVEEVLEEVEELLARPAAPRTYVADLLGQPDSGRSSGT